MLDEERAAAPDTALHGDRGSLTLAAGWPMASPVFNQGRNHTANPGERSAPAPGPSRPESRSNHAGIPVKCSRNRRQVRRNPQSRDSASLPATHPARGFDSRSVGPVIIAGGLLERSHLEISGRVECMMGQACGIHPSLHHTFSGSAPRPAMHDEAAKSSGRRHRSRE